VAAHLTKLASDEFHLKWMMKDILDDLHIKFCNAGMDDSGLYVLGIQTHLADVRIYLMERRDAYRLHLLKTFSLPLSFASFRNLRVAMKWAWNLRGLVNNLLSKLDDLIEDAGTPPPRPFSDEMETVDTPVKAKKIRTAKS